MIKYLVLILLLLFTSVYSQGRKVRGIDLMPELRNVVGHDVEWYGAKPNDGIVDSKYINDAINESGAQKIIIGNAITDTFDIRQGIEWKDNLQIVLNGYLKMIDAVTRSLTQTAEIGDDTIYVASASTYYQIDDYVLVRDSTTTKANSGGSPDQDNDRTQGTVAKVLIATPTYLVLSDTIGQQCHIDSVGIVTTFNSVMYGWEKSNIHITGKGVIDGNKANQLNAQSYTPRTDLYYEGDEHPLGGRGIAVIGCDSVRIDGIHIKNSISHNIDVKQSEKVHVENTKLIGANDKNYIATYSKYLWVLFNEAASSVKEDGIVFYTNDSITYCIGNYIHDNHRHAIGGSPGRGFSAFNRCINNGDGINWGGDDLVSIGDYIEGGGLYSGDDSPTYLLRLRNADNIILSNITIRDPATASNGCIMIERSRNILINGGTVGGTTGSSARGVGVHITERNAVNSEDITIQNMLFEDLKEGIRIDENDAENVKLINCRFQNNTNNYAAAGTYFTNAMDAGEVQIIDCDSLFTYDYHLKDKIFSDSKITIKDSDLDTLILDPKTNNVIKYVDGSSVLFEVDSTGRVGIGRSRSSNNYNLTIKDHADIIRDGNSAFLIFRSYRSGAPGSQFYYDHARGSEASPSVLNVEDKTMELVGRVWDGNSWEQSVSLKGVVDGDVSDSDVPGRISMWTTPDGTKTPVERLLIKASGETLVQYGLLIGGASNTQIDSLSADSDSLYIYFDSAWKSLKLNNSDGPN